MANNIIYITDNPIKKSEIKKLKPYVNYLQAKKHYEYDWGSYKQGYFYLKEQNRLPTEQLIFANDSVIGPLQDINTLFYTMNSRNNDFWGITANIDIQYHIQSYFLVFNKNVFDDTNFANFLIKVKQQEESWDVVFKYEVPFTKYLEDLGYVSDVFIDYEALSFLPLNDKNCYPLTILSQYKMPFLKLRTFTNRLTVQESRRLVFNWLKKHNPDNYKELILHLEKIKSPYLKEAR